MKPCNSSYPQVKLSKCQVILYLIKEELKCRKLFHGLREAGFDECYFQPHLDSLILNKIGLDDGTDETFSMYDTIMEKRSKKIAVNRDSIMIQAYKVYVALMNEKKKLSQNT